MLTPKENGLYKEVKIVAIKQFGIPLKTITEGQLVILERTNDCPEQELERAEYGQFRSPQEPGLQYSKQDDCRPKRVRQGHRNRK